MQPEEEKKNHHPTNAVLSRPELWLKVNYYDS